MLRRSLRSLVEETLDELQHDWSQTTQDDPALVRAIAETIVALNALLATLPRR